MNERITPHNAVPAGWGLRRMRVGRMARNVFGLVAGGTEQLGYLLSAHAVFNALVVTCRLTLPPMYGIVPQAPRNQECHGKRENRRRNDGEHHPSSPFNVPQLRVSVCPSAGPRAHRWSGFLRFPRSFRPAQCCASIPRWWNSSTRRSFSASSSRCSLTYSTTASNCSRSQARHGPLDEVEVVAAVKVVKDVHHRDAAPFHLRPAAEVDDLNGFHCPCPRAEIGGRSPTPLPTIVRRKRLSLVALSARKTKRPSGRSGGASRRPHSPCFISSPAAPWPPFPSAGRP